MKTTLKTFALLLLTVVISISAHAEGESSKKIVSPQLNVKIIALDATNVAVLFNKLDGEVVKVKIYDESGILIYSEKEVKGTTYGKKFNLKSYPSSNYTYKVSNELYSISKVIELK